MIALFSNAGFQLNSARIKLAEPRTHNQCRTLVAPEFFTKPSLFRLFRKHCNTFVVIRNAAEYSVLPFLFFFLVTLLQKLPRDLIRYLVGWECQHSDHLHLRHLESFEKVQAHHIEHIYNFGTITHSRHAAPFQVEFLPAGGSNIVFCRERRINNSQLTVSERVAA